MYTKWDFNLLPPRTETACEFVAKEGRHTWDKIYGCFRRIRWFWLTNTSIPKSHPHVKGLSIGRVSVKNNMHCMELFKDH